tara:strand:- start:1399 stop:3144 length:1746 start_codon:yes stop_codon:yes gene_type:complete
MQRNRYQFPEHLDDYAGNPQPKVAGRKSPGERGGVYSHHGEQLMIKRETLSGKAQPHKVIAEFIGASMMDEMVPGAAPLTFFVSAAHSKSFIPDETGSDVYVASVFFPKGYQSLFTTSSTKPDSERKSGHETIGAGKVELREGIYEKDAQGHYYKSRFQHYDEVTLASLRIGDFDVTSINLGIYDDRVRRIDFGEALTKIEDDVHIHSHTKHPGFFGPTNHFREIPRHVKISQHFADAIQQMNQPENQARLHARIGEAADEIGEWYGVKPIQAFAKHVGLPAYETSDKQDLLAKLKGFLIAKDERRARSLQKLEMEIRLSLCFTRDEASTFPRFECDEDKLVELMRRDPLYFIKNDFHFRGKDQRLNIGLVKVKYQSLVRRTQQFVSEHHDILIRQAVFDGKPEVIEAMKQSKSLGAYVSDEIHMNVLRRYYGKLLNRMKSDGMKELKSQVIEEILFEKSSPHRTSIMARYIDIYQGADDENLKRTIRNVLFNPSIRRLGDAGLGKQLQVFYAEARTDALTRQKKLQEEGKAQQSPQPADNILQAKWDQLSIGCEKVDKTLPVPEGLIADNNVVPPTANRS